MSKQQKGTPSPGPLRGFPAHGRRLSGGQKLAALKHLSSFISKRPPHSGDGDKGNQNVEDHDHCRGENLSPDWPPSLLKEGLGVVGFRTNLLSVPVQRVSLRTLFSRGDGHGQRQPTITIRRINRPMADAVWAVLYCMGYREHPKFILNMEAKKCIYILTS